MKKIAVMIETSRAYGRALMEGIAAFAQEAGDWKLRSLPNERITAEQLKDYDGLILRLADAETAQEITRAHLPASTFMGTDPKQHRGTDPRHPMGSVPQYRLRTGIMRRSGKWRRISSSSVVSATLPGAVLTD